MSLRPVAIRASASLAAGILALLGAELALRRWTPENVRAFASERTFHGQGREEPDTATFTFDDELGYRPILGSALYNPHGTLRNDYSPEKPAGVRRLLFLGDSVTKRGMIQAGLREALGDQGLEYWNAGIEGYSTAQEAAWYRRYCTDLAADHVLLVFHLNDFQSTPVTFRHGEHMVVMYTKDSSRTLNPWLLRYSFLYRWYLSRGFEANELTPNAPPRGVQEVIERALVELRDETAKEGTALTVLVFPWLRPLDLWPGSMPPKRAWILATLERLGIRHFDFLPTLEQALADGVEVMEKSHDPQHPSLEFGRRMARDMLAAGFMP